MMLICIYLWSCTEHQTQEYIPTGQLTAHGCNIARHPPFVLQLPRTQPDLACDMAYSLLTRIDDKAIGFCLQRQNYVVHHTILSATTRCHDLSECHQRVKRSCDLSFTLNTVDFSTKRCMPGFVRGYTRAYTVGTFPTHAPSRA